MTLFFITQFFSCDGHEKLTGSMVPINESRQFVTIVISSYVPQMRILRNREATWPLVEVATGIV